MNHTYNLYRIFAVAVLSSSLILLSCATQQILPFNSEYMGEAKKHMNYLASDDMRGRNTPSPELDKSAEYIAQQFKQYGLEPVNGSSFHTYNLQRTKLGDNNSFSVNLGLETISFALNQDFTLLNQSTTVAIKNADLVFVGYGITAPEYKWDDYANVDVKNKVVVMVSGEPDNADSTFFAGKRFTRYTFNNTKARIAQKNGALGMIVLTNPKTDARLRRNTAMHIDSNAGAGALRYISPNTKPFAAISGTTKLVETLFSTNDSLKKIILTIDSTKTSNSYSLRYSTSVTLNYNNEKVPVKNVMGMIRGTDDNGEYIVIGGHYDHVGVHLDSRKDTTSTTPPDSIYNGADDNASGTTGVMLAAKALTDMKQKPKRSIVFVCFSGEEKGLLGSQAFTAECPLDITKCAAMLNMDMIGRNNPDSLSLGGGSRSPEFISITTELNKTIERPFTLAENIESYFFRSDQANFASKKIPVIFYFSDEHKDYHQPGDEISKINFDKLLRITQLCTRTAWKVANLEYRLKYIPQGNEE